MPKQILAGRRARRAPLERIPSAIPEKFQPGHAGDIVPPPGALIDAPDWLEKGAAAGTSLHADRASTLRQTPPPAIIELLGQQSIGAEDLLLCTDSDTTSDGAYGRQWLLATRERVIVCSDGNTPVIHANLVLKNASEFRCEGVVGAGILQARVDGMFIDLVRFSNRLGDRFSKVARKLDHAAHGAAITIEPEDDVDPRRCRSCGMMLDFQGESCPRCVNKGAVLARMASLMRPYRAAAIAMMALMLFGIAIDMIGPKLTQHLVDHVLPGDSAAARAIMASGSALQSRLGALLLLVGILAASQVARMFINIFNGRLGTRVGTAIASDMRGRLVEHLQQLSVSYYDRQQVGSLVGRVAYDTEALQGFIGQLTGGFVFQIVMVAVAGAMMFSINAKLATFTLVPAPLVILGTIIFWRYIYPRYYRFWDASSKQAGMLSGMLSGVRVVKAFGQESRETRRFNDASDYLLNSRRGVDASTCTFNPIMGLVFQLGGWIVWYVGGRDVLGDKLTLGALMAFFGYLWMFYSPLGALTQFTNWLTSFVTQAHRLFEILDTPIQIADVERPLREPLRGEIEFQNVSFGYNRHQQVLRDISLRVGAGEMLGVVGRSGSGKSTLINLICRFYDVSEGRILMDGREVREYAKDSLRGQIGVVLQEPFLFRGSIWENIAYGKPGASPEEVIRAAKAGNCHDFILRNPHGYDTWVGERGAGLSGGERQRVSIARVLLTDPKVLILDEATSSVDAESEAAIQAAMAELVKGRTTIAIAHRLSTLRNANRIIVVDNGRIIESGTHEQLVEQNGLYARLAKIQGQLAPPPSMDLLLAEEAEASRHATIGQAERPSSNASHPACETSDSSPSNPNSALCTLRSALPPAHSALCTLHSALPRPLPPLGGFQPRWLRPGVDLLHLGVHNALHVTIPEERSYGGAFAVRCMPVRSPSQYISVRYLDQEKREVEIGLIRDLAEWPADARDLIERSLGRRYFVHTIQAVRDIRQFQNYLRFDVETDLGARQFIMRWQADKAPDFGAGGKMLHDTEDNRYLVPNVQSLPERDRRIFMRYIYW